MAGPTKEKIGFGTKTNQFLIKKSREAVENYSNVPVLYFEVDVENSKRNFYGEMIIKKWKNSRGIKVSGTAEITESDNINLADIPNKITQLKFSCYVDHLRELGIWPQAGDYFSIKNRFYFIQTKEILDVNEHTINVDNEAYSIVFHCGEADSESVIPQISSEYDEDGYANQLLDVQAFNQESRKK